MKKAIALLLILVLLPVSALGGENLAAVEELDWFVHDPFDLSYNVADGVVHLLLVNGCAVLPSIMGIEVGNSVLYMAGLTFICIDDFFYADNVTILVGDSRQAFDDTWIRLGENSKGWVQSVANEPNVMIRITDFYGKQKDFKMSDNQKYALVSMYNAYFDCDIEFSYSPNEQSSEKSLPPEPSNDDTIIF